MNKVFMYQQNTLIRSISHLQIGEKNYVTIWKNINKDKGNIQGRIQMLFGLRYFNVGSLRKLESQQCLVLMGSFEFLTS